MVAELLLCSLLLAADPTPAPVSVRLLTGSPAESQQSEVEPWVRWAMVKAGSPQATPVTGWIALTGEDQKLGSPLPSQQVIQAKALVRDGNYHISLSGFTRQPPTREFVLKPGERRVLSLPPAAADANAVFIALEAPLSEQAKSRAAKLKANVGTFRLNLNYGGEEDKPFYRLAIGVEPLAIDRNSPFDRTLQVTEPEAKQIIDHLARDGFLDHAIDLRAQKEKLAPTTPGYTLRVTAGDQEWQEDLGWSLPLMHRLEGLRTVIPESGQKEMDFLLGRLSGLRLLWEAEQSGLQGQARRPGSRLRFFTDDDSSIVDITSEFGIDQATLQRRTEAWPKAVVVRLHLSGLESFKIRSKSLSVEWSVASTGDHAVTSTLVSGKRVAMLAPESPYYSEIRMVGGMRKIPLKDGYFEVLIPSKLFEDNPAEISLEWIDFYRN